MGYRMYQHQILMMPFSDKGLLPRRIAFGICNSIGEKHSAVGQN